MNKESSIWQVASIKTLLRGDQVKYFDIEGMRAVADNRSIAEQIKSDKVESAATGGVKNWRIWKSWKIGEFQN